MGWNIPTNTAVEHNVVEFVLIFVGCGGGGGGRVASLRDDVLSLHTTTSLRDIPFTAHCWVHTRCPLVLVTLGYSSHIAIVTLG